MSHLRGWWGAIANTVEQVVSDPAITAAPADDVDVVLFPPMLSPADWRGLMATAADCGVKALLVPDGRQSLDGGPGSGIAKLPDGGVALTRIAALESDQAWLQLGGKDLGVRGPGAVMRENFGVPGQECAVPIGVEASDAWVDSLIKVGGGHLGEETNWARGRTLDLLADAHKTLKDARIAIQGDGDLAPALARMVAEIGAKPVVVASDEKLGAVAKELRELGGVVLDDADYKGFANALKEESVDMILGSSRCYPTARAQQIPSCAWAFPCKIVLAAPASVTSVTRAPTN